MNIFFFGQSGRLSYLSTLFLNVSPTTINDGTSQSSSHTINVTSNVSWSVISEPAWVGITSGSSGTGNGSTNISISQNNTGGSRSGSINYIGDEGLTASVSVTQGFTRFITLSPTNFSFTSSSHTGNMITISSSVSWTTSISSGDEFWITIQNNPTGGPTNLLVTTFDVSANPFANPRSATITFNDTGSSLSPSVTINQDPGSFE